MQAELTIKCGGCAKCLGKVQGDTADMPEVFQSRVNKVILAHRPECPAYSGIQGSGRHLLRFSVRRSSKPIKFLK